MFAWLLRPIRLLVSAVAAHDSPRQLAWGATLGMAVGLVPKGNLTALLLGMALFALRANLAVGLAAAGLFTWIGWLLDPSAHRLGWQILSWQPLQPFYTRVYDLPLVPWTGLNNTVVLGQLVLGMYLAYPVYRGSYLAAERWRESVVDRLRRYRVARALLGLDIASRVKWGQ